MIKYIHIPEQKKTIAILEGTKYDAVKQIKKVLSDTKSIQCDITPYLMHDYYRAVVVCHENDTYDRHEGEYRAKEKLLEHYYEQLDKRFLTFIHDVQQLRYLL